MAEAATTFLLEKLKEVVREYHDLIAGAENEFRQLESDLILFMAFLKDSAKRKEKPHRLKETEKVIREVVYEVEDTIDACLTKAIEAKAKEKPGRNIFGIRTSRSKRSSVLRSYNLASELKSLREERVLPVFSNIEIKLNHGSESFDDTETRLRMRREMPIRQNRVVGFEVEERTIIGYLIQETERLEVIPIIGIHGQGKTTLAWKVYQNMEICFHFPIRIWVYISQMFSIRDVLLQIMRKFTPSQDMSDLNDDELGETVRACLETEKFLLVLDDVWSVDVWKEIKRILPLGNTKSKVVITSREETVGDSSRTIRKEPFKLPLLTEPESWKLLQYEVFVNENDYPSELENIGRHIANKCDGVPLTIVVIGGILLDLQLGAKSIGEAKKEWEMVAKNVSRTLGKDQRINDVVELSYNRLPDRLSDCFVYMGVFPEDYEIPVKMLYGLWIAEGFIQSMEGFRSLEEVAEYNLNDLISRNLVKAERINHIGKVKTCRLSDIIRAFCITKSKEDNLFEEIHISSTTGALEPSVSKVQTSHRLCFHSELSNFLSGAPEGPHVRSFLCFYKHPVESRPEHLSAIPDGFPKLRILESKSVKFFKFPANITKLIHLRYLTLFIDNLTFLPGQISQLWNLQTIVVETKTRTIRMDANLWKMIRMRHLKTKSAIILDNTWDGEAGQSLQTLNRLSPDSCTEAVSRRAKNLRTLGISGELAKLFGTKFLENLHNLEKLKLVNSLSYEQTSDDHMHHLPLRNFFPPYLKRLTLQNTFFDWRDMSVLAMIKSLEALKLKDNAFVGLSWNVSGYDFPNLTFLLIVNADFVVWEASTDAFPTLKVLVVKNCENLVQIPECVGTHLEKLEVERLRSSAVDSAMKIKKTQRGVKEGTFILNIGPVTGTM